MFQSEHLQEKWAPLLNHEGCEKISDPWELLANPEFNIKQTLNFFK